MEGTAIDRIEFVAVTPAKLAVDRLVGEIGGALAAGKRVVWFVSGGSAATLAARASTRLPASQKLLVLQVDERYGLPDHPDANWRKLREAGFMAEKFVCYPMLGDDDFATIIEKYSQMVEVALRESEFSVGLFGIGADGHTAGLLPGSEALQSERLVAGFQGPDYQRITITAPAIAKLDLAVAYAVGEEKLPALQEFHEELTVEQQPAQALKAAGRVVIFTDQTERSEEAA
ncbi:6-phosphogluconolactonase [Candidatus Saccharibacteria bacterium]|nr:6-phosphogluconolactonase [Candidatus Saccharibacteria bacterium]